MFYARLTFYICAFFLLANSLTLFAAESYDVKFSGIDEETVEFLRSVSHLESLKENAPLTKTGLKRRAEADVPNFIKAMQSKGYFGTQVDLNINYDLKPIEVLFQVNIGPIYPLAAFNLISAEEKDCENFFPDCIELCQLEIEIGEPALPKNIIKAEEKLLDLLNKNSYPLAKITKREVLADQTTKDITVNIYIDQGPFCYFGLTTIKGNKTILDEMFWKKILWIEGWDFDPKLIEKTQSALEATRLFSSVSITHAQEAVDGFLPIEIQVIESKQRSIAAGASYSTEQGFGVIAEWEHRNIHNLGEKLSIKTSISQRIKEGRLLYVKPDFKIPGQDLLWILEAQHEITEGFIAASLSASGIIERQVSDRLRISYGLTFKRLVDRRSDNNGVFTLLKTPLILRWSNTNSLLDPTKGFTVNFKTIPSFQILKPRFGYTINTLSVSHYIPLSKDEKYVFAAKGTWGAIVGSPDRSIPASERFYAGSENLLRGYRFLTVSPLDRCHRPMGGRSMMIYSLETRIRSADSLGWVLFYDFGNVYSNYFPAFNKKILQSTGIGARYGTPVGPLRVDLAFPLNRRKHVDSYWQLYLSIGQAF